MFIKSLLSLFSNSPIVVAVASALLVGVIIWHLTTRLSPKIRNLISASLVLLMLAAVILSVVVEHNPSLTYSGKGEIDTVGGTAILMRVQSGTDENGKEVSVSPSSLAQAVQSVEKRLVELNIKDLYIEAKGHDQIYLELPGIDASTTELVLATLKTQARLELKQVHPDTRTLAPVVAADPDNNRVPGYQLKFLSYEDDDGVISSEPILLKRRTSIDGSYILYAQELYGPHEGKLTVKLSAAGAEKMFDLTSKMRHGVDRLAIVLDGKVFSAPTVQSTLGAQFEISGMKNAAEAKHIATALLNPLKNPLVIVEVRTISPELAAKSSE